MHFEPIAIVGQSCTLPEALTPAELWANVLAGRDCLSRAPEDRWGMAKALAMGTVEASADSTWSDVGGYVNGFSRAFDPTGFALPADEVRELDPVFQMVLHGTREALRGSGQLSEAIVELEQARTLAPEQAGIHHQLGEALIEAGRPAEAMVALERAIALDPSHAQARNDLGVALVSSGRIDEAIAEFETALRLQPDLSDGLLNLEIAQAMRQASATPAAAE